MPRYKLVIEYDGTNFSGWQRQGAGIPSVQAAIEEAFVKFCGEQPTLMGAGRTDAGVHALGQVAHLDLPQELEPTRIQDALNYYLHATGVAILAVATTTPSFNARFDAINRTYLYRIGNRRAIFPLEVNRLWHIVSPLDIGAMQAGANFLIGHHDFSAFCAGGGCGSNKTLDNFTIQRDGDYITLSVQARSFLHNQVRIMVGTLQQVGRGKWPPEQVGAVLLKKDRRLAGPTAPPYGLYLLKVGY